MKTKVAYTINCGLRSFLYWKAPNILNYHLKMTFALWHFMLHDTSMSNSFMKVQKPPTKINYKLCPGVAKPLYLSKLKNGYGGDHSHDKNWNPWIRLETFNSCHQCFMGMALKWVLNCKREWFVLELKRWW